MTLPGEELVEVASSQQRKRAGELALVLQSIGIPHQLFHHAGRWRVLVAARQAAAARSELEGYLEENRDWPRREEPVRIRSRGWAGAAAYAAVLVVMHPFGRRGMFGWNAWEGGRLEAGSLLSGDWWRAITALTLHGDVGHLASNLLFGIVFGVLCAHVLGSGLAWLAILLSGALGNLLNAAIQSPSHMAIGASTANFGALGILVGAEWARRSTSRDFWMRIAPLFAGGVLLGWLGTGGGGEELQRARTDVVAHVTGMAAGLALGRLLLALHLPDRLSARAQRLCAAATLALLALAWLAARFA